MKKKRNLSTPQHVFVLQAKTPLRSIPNALTFKVKRTCVFTPTPLSIKKEGYITRCIPPSIL